MTRTRTRRETRTTRWSVLAGESMSRAPMGDENETRPCCSTTAFQRGVIGVLGLHFMAGWTSDIRNASLRLQLARGHHLTYLFGEIFEETLPAQCYLTENLIDTAGGAAVCLLENPNA